MKTNKLVSWTLILSQVAFALAQSASADVRTPEAQLLKRAIAIQGQALGATEAQTEMKNIVDAYMATAPVDGQNERMEQALVDLKMYTANQAHSFMADANAATARVQNVN